MKPVLLLIPGMLNTAAVWDAVIPGLQGKAEVRIAEVQSQSTIAQMARDAWALLADVPPDQPLVICAFSMGGYVAIEMLASGARPVRAAGLFDTSGKPESPEGAAMREKTIAAIGRDFEKVIAGVAQFATHPDSHANAALMQGFLAMMRAVGAETAVRQNRAILGRADHRAALAKLAVPVLVLCGAEDRITPPPLAEELAATIPGARLEIIAGAGHLSLLEQPHRVAELLITLL